MISKSEKVRFLVERQFPDYAAIEARRYPTGEDRLDGRYSDFSDYIDQLWSLTGSDLDQRYIEQKHEQARALLEQQYRDDEARFFAMPDVNVDFALWCQMPHWDTAEAVAIVLGKDPARVPPSLMQELAGQSPFARRYLA